MSESFHVNFSFPGPVHGSSEDFNKIATHVKLLTNHIAKPSRGRG
jgi:hypothetical protein